MQKKKREREDREEGVPKESKGNDTPRAHTHTRDIAQALRNKDTAEAHAKRERFLKRHTKVRWEHRE